jgi:hypothetical protein
MRGSVMVVFRLLVVVSRHGLKIILAELPAKLLDAGANEIILSWLMV